MPSNEFDPTTFEPPFLAPRSTPSLGATVVSDVKRALFCGEIKAGSFLGTEKDLVQKYGVGRHSIRDGLHSLDALGLVEIRRGAHGGVVVAESNMDRFAEALAIQFKLADVGSDQVLAAQGAIEGMAAELAASHRTESDLQRLSALLGESEALLDDPSAFTRNGLAFHAAIARASHNDVLVALLNTLRFVIWSGRPRSLPKVAAKVHGIHRELYTLIEGGDAEKAGSLMRTHILDIRSKHADSKKGDGSAAHNCC